MIGNKEFYGEEIDKEVKATIVEKGIKACNKLFTTTDESEIHQSFRKYHCMLKTNRSDVCTATSRLIWTVLSWRSTLTKACGGKVW
jgi:hypothetical protein